MNCSTVLTAVASVCVCVGAVGAVGVNPDALGRMVVRRAGEGTGTGTGILVVTLGLFGLGLGPGLAPMLMTGRLLGVTEDALFTVSPAVNVSRRLESRVVRELGAAEVDLRFSRWSWRAVVDGRRTPAPLKIDTVAAEAGAEAEAEAAVPFGVGGGLEVGYPGPGEALTGVFIWPCPCPCPCPWFLPFPATRLALPGGGNNASLAFSFARRRSCASLPVAPGGRGAMTNVLALLLLLLLLLVVLRAVAGAEAEAGAEAGAEAETCHVALWARLSLGIIPKSGLDKAGAVAWAGVWAVVDTKAWACAFT